MFTDVLSPEDPDIGVLKRKKSPPEYTEGDHFVVLEWTVGPVKVDSEL